MAAWALSRLRRSIYIHTHVVQSTASMLGLTSMVWVVLLVLTQEPLGKRILVSVIVIGCSRVMQRL